MTNEEEIVEPGAQPVEEAQGDSHGDMLDKATASKIIARERQKAFEKGKQEAMMQMQQEQQQQAQQAAPQQQAPQQMGGMQQMSQADIERQIAERIPQALQQHVNQLKTEHTINTFVNKMQAAEAKHPGLEAKLNDLDYASMAPLVQMANDMDNTGDIMKELLDNPMKMGNLLTLMNSQPRLAQKAMLDLSNSIKQNDDAIAKDKQAQDPMSQIKSSTKQGTDNNASSMSVMDLRKMLSSKR
jgi:hypothetical protein